MSISQNNIQELNIKELLSSDNSYLIPIYQRNYAWGEKEISQLLQDIIDYLPSNKNYYLGTLVVYETIHNGKTTYETIDGQQRLTTLSILLSLLKNEHIDNVDTKWFSKLNLCFYSREIATKTLDAAFKGYFENNQDYKESIKTAYELIAKNLPIKLSENDISIQQFGEYLFKYVKILRVPVPEDTDLNHYFEIMNNRGEQLEKHEILKSKLLEILNTIDDEDEKRNHFHCFNKIWEACSNMEKYVQYGFDTTERDKIFKKNNWNGFIPNDFDAISNSLKTTPVKDNENLLSISEIIEGKAFVIHQEVKDDNPDRFNSVINFSNFLLHVLKLQLKANIALDDKRLLQIFEKQLKGIDDKYEKIEFAKQFGYNLLKTKFLFDKYIIKREYIAGTDKWSLKRLKWYEGNKVSYVNTYEDEPHNRNILMLLSMFHVSTPTLVYKHWLNGALKYVFEHKKIRAKKNIESLESLAATFVFDRFLAVSPIDYYQMIYENEGVLQNFKEDLNLKKLTYYNIENNLVFNYLDYLLWRDNEKEDSIINNFEYSFRSSVEHYYPQTPMEGYKALDDIPLNSFGNLCLISHNKNSRLSNLMPTSKKEYYANNKIDSLKQYMMMQVPTEQWNEEAIKKHNEKMINLFLEQLEYDIYG